MSEILSMVHFWKDSTLIVIFARERESWLHIFNASLFSRGIVLAALSFVAASCSNFLFLCIFV